MFWKTATQLENISTVRSALSFLLGKRFVKKFSHIEDCYLIKSVAEYIGRQPLRLLFSVAYLNGMEAKKDLEQPSVDIINQMGYSLECLKAHRILPQPYKDRFSVVIADTRVINVDEWITSGIPVYLAFGQLIDEIYQNFSPINIALKNALNELTNVVIEAQNNGSHELCLGTINDNSCEYSLGDESINKNIDDNVYSSLLSYLNIASKVTLTLPMLENKKISVTKLQNGARAVLYITWNIEEPLHNKVKTEWTDKSIQDLILKTALNAMPIPYSLQ